MRRIGGCEAWRAGARSSLLAGVALGMVMGVALVSCAARGPQNAREHVSHYEPDPHKQEIMLLWKEIRDWRADAGMVKREPAGLLKRQSSAYSVAAARAVCPHDREPQTPACRDVCSLADNICDNADSICRIADEDLKGDAWAQEKCDSAKASCKEAKQRCCRCNGARTQP